MRYITFALTKGRLANKAMELLAHAEVTCEEMKKDTRKLIFTNEEHGFKFFLAKATDVPTYVEHGAADIGIVGKDTIMEEKRHLCELLDLGFGKCRMVVAGYKEAAEKLQKGNDLRVATKYPNIAADYFYKDRRQTVEIIKLNGSIELAPIVGLADVIVDIVETGSTIEQNGLVILEEICNLSARMVANRVSLKMEHDRIFYIVNKIKGCV